MYEESSEIFTPQPVYASFWERFGAAFIDAILVGIVDYGLIYLLSDNMLQPPLYIRAINLVIGISYFGYFESSEKQATLGKQALGLRVTGMSGERISFMNAVGRYFGRLLSTIILLIGYLMMLWDDKKQTLHDKLAKTLVVKA